MDNVLDIRQYRKIIEEKKLEENKVTYRLDEYDALFLRMLKDYDDVSYNRNNLHIVKE